MSDEVNNIGFLLQNLMDQTLDHIYFKDKDSRFIMVNRAFCEWAGLMQDQLLGRSDFDLFAEAHARQAFEDEQRIIATGEPLIGIEEKETWNDGRITWVSTTKMPLRSPAGEIIGTFGVSRDITDHKEAELRAAYYAEQIQRIKEEMEEDMRMAGELQKTFFPSFYPGFPADAPSGQECVQFSHHYHSSGLVSGDFCAIRQISATQAAIFVCDVMGHGVRAALVTALIRAMIDEISPLELNPGRHLARMNEQLLPILRQEDLYLYATACYVVLDVSTGTIRFANAGHPVPLHFHGNGVQWLMDDPALRGPALAIADDATFATFEKKLDPGDAVVMFTDGLYEVVGPNNEEFSEARLLEAARRHTGLDLPLVLPALINEARLFSEDGEFDDDVCLVGFRLRRLLC